MCLLLGWPPSSLCPASAPGTNLSSPSFLSSLEQSLLSLMTSVIQLEILPFWGDFSLFLALHISHWQNPAEFFLNDIFFPPSHSHCLSSHPGFMTSYLSNSSRWYPLHYRTTATRALESLALLRPTQTSYFFTTLLYTLCYRAVLPITVFQRATEDLPPPPRGCP